MRKNEINLAHISCHAQPAVTTAPAFIPCLCFLPLTCFEPVRFVIQKNYLLYSACILLDKPACDKPPGGLRDITDEWADDRSWNVSLLDRPDEFRRIICRRINCLANRVFGQFSMLMRDQQ